MQIMKIKSLSNCASAAMTMAGAVKVSKQVPIGLSENTPAYSVRVFTIEAEGHTPFHAHPYEHLNYIISGSGYLVNEAGEKQPIETGDFALVNPDEKHQYQNGSLEEPLVLICAVPKEFE